MGETRTDTPPILIVGWDGAPYDVIGDMLAADELPTLKSIAEDGHFGPLETVPYVMSSCAWSTFLTGTNAGKHGVYDFYADNFREGSYFREPINATARDGEEFGETLDRHGDRLGKLNVPMTYPARPSTGFTITGMLTPSKDADGFCYPSDFLEDYDGLEEYQIDSGEGKDRVRDEFLNEIQEIVDGRQALTLYALRREPVDVFFVVFTSPDRLSHHFYHFYDEEHPFRVNETRADLEAYEDILPDLFRDLDTRLEEIIEVFQEEYGEQPLVSVISDHGMRSLKKVFHVNKWLESAGYLEFLPGARSSEEAVDDDVEELLDDRVEYIFGKVDWPATDAYAMGKRGAIYVNVEGREPEGVVPSEEREAVVDAIADDLREVKDPDTGEPMVESIHRRDDLFHGPHVDKAPDLLLGLAEGYYPFGYAFELEKPDIVSTNDWSDMPFVTGIEDGPGIFAIAGEGIDDEVEPVDIGLEDVVPTVLHYLGHPVPEQIDGQVIGALFDEEISGDIEFDTSAGKKNVVDTDTEEDKQKVRDRLEDLGYL